VGIGYRGNAGNIVRRRRSPLAQERQQEREEEEEEEEEEQQQGVEAIEYVESQSNPSWSIGESDSNRPSGGDPFYERNRELCNGRFNDIRFHYNITIFGMNQNF